MTAINAYKEHQENLIDIGTKEKFVKVAAIMVPMPVKVKLHLAMYYFQRIVAESMNNVDENHETAIVEYYVPFAFDGEKENSEFEIIEIVDGFEYKYGFEYNDKRIVSEWLYRKSLETNRNTIILERTEEEISLGSSVRKECDIYKEQIPHEALALSFFNRLKLKTDIF